ncbi:hypothetical protein EAI_11614, partial [Harpegnathos saltator]
FYVESMAILRAANIVASERPDRVSIFTDSFSTINALNSSDLEGESHRIIQRIKVAVWKISREGIYIILVWIPAHKNIPGNEMANTLA